MLKDRKDLSTGVPLKISGSDRFALALQVMMHAGIQMNPVSGALLTMIAMILTLTHIPPQDSTFPTGVFATDDQTFMVPSAWAGWTIQGWPQAQDGGFEYIAL